VNATVGTFARGLAVAVLLAPWLAACAETPAETPAPRDPFAVVAGHPARLELEPVSVDPRCSSPYPISQLRAKFTAGDGKVYATPIFTPNGLDTAGLAPLNPAELAGSATFGQVTGGDLFYLPPADLLPLIGGDLVVDAWLTRQPATRARLVVHPRFNCPQYVDLSGRPGSQAGLYGRGSFGEPGPNVRVAVGYVNGPADKPLILVRIDDARGLRARTVISPDAPPLQIVLDGGAGGSGGSVLTGPGGDGGDGGAAEILYDDAAPELERKVVIVNRGGPGGTGGGGNGRAGRPGPLPRTEPESVRGLFHDEIAHGVPIRIHGAIEPAKNQSI
jgi:hypothetical protein